MKKLLLALMIGMMGCDSAPSHSGKVKHGYDLTNKDVIAGSIVVDLKDDVSDSDVAELSKMVGVRLHADNPTAKKFKIEHGKVDPSREQEVLDQLNEDGRVEHAEPSIKVSAMFVPNDPMYGDQWGITRIGSESAWNMTCGRNVVVAVIDTGVATGLSDFAGTKFTEGYDFIDNDDDATSLNPHGSHVAATISETTNNGIGAAGIANCATIMPVRVLDQNGSGSMESVGEGIIWAADNGAAVINLSLGAHMPSGIVEDAINHALDAGTVVVAANGNSGGSIGWPAAYPGVIAVSAFDKNDNIADFSSRGSETVVGAPGVDILQITCGEDGKGEQYQRFSGTSMASPHTAAVAALVVSNGVSKPSAVKAKLMDTAEDLGLDHDEQGAGLVRADKAVRSIVFNHLFLRIFVLGGILFFLRKRISMAAVKSKQSVLGIVATVCGAFPIMFLGVLPRMGSLRVLGEMASRSVLEWNNVFGFMTKYLPLGYVVPAVLASLLLLNSKAKSLAGGLALGTMAFCTQMAYSNEVNFFLGGWMFRGVMIASAFVSLYFVKTIFEKKA